jgi:cytochrome c2
MRTKPLAILGSALLAVALSVVAVAAADERPATPLTPEQQAALLARCGRCHSLEAVAARHVAAREPHQNLFEAKCRKCHSLDRVSAAHRAGQSLSPVVERMQHKYGSDITEADARELDMWIERIKSLP